MQSAIYAAAILSHLCIVKMAKFITHNSFAIQQLIILVDWHQILSWNSEWWLSGDVRWRWVRKTSDFPPMW